MSKLVKQAAGISPTAQLEAFRTLLFLPGSSHSDLKLCIWPDTLLLFQPAFPWARHQENSPARRLRTVCFSDSSQQIATKKDDYLFPPPKSRHSLWELSPFAFGVPQVKEAKKEKENMYLNSIQIIGFLGKDPERRHVQDNGNASTVLPVATRRPWKDAQASCAPRPSGTA